MAKNSETIIVAYKQANADASEILTYLDSISNPMSFSLELYSYILRFLVHSKNRIFCAVAHQNYYKKYLTNQ